jgi:hypothetical protein
MEQASYPPSLDQVNPIAITAVRDAINQGLILGPRLRINVCW